MIFQSRPVKILVLSLFYIYCQIISASFGPTTFECKVCGYIYDELKGYAEGGITPGTKWEDLPESYLCPICQAGKGMIYFM
jgi:rubredoxin